MCAHPSGSDFQRDAFRLYLLSMFLRVLTAQGLILSLGRIINKYINNEYVS